MKRLFPAMFFLCVLPLLVHAQEQSQNAGPEYEMRTYYMGFLYRGEKWTPEKTEETARIQTEHLAHIGAMAKSGKLILAGPFLDNTDLRGIFLFDVETMEEAQALCDQDPAVKAGRLRVELKPWYSAKGITIGKKD